MKKLKLTLLVLIIFSVVGLDNLDSPLSTKIGDSASEVDDAIPSPSIIQTSRPVPIPTIAPVFASTSPTINPTIMPSKKTFANVQKVGGADNINKELVEESATALNSARYTFYTLLFFMLLAGSTCFVKWCVLLLFPSFLVSKFVSFGRCVSGHLNTDLASEPNVISV